MYMDACASCCMTSRLKDGSRARGSASLLWLSEAPFMERTPLVEPGIEGTVRSRDAAEVPRLFGITTGDRMPFGLLVPVGLTIMLPPLAAALLTAAERSS